MTLHSLKNLEDYIASPLADPQHLVMVGLDFSSKTVFISFFPMSNYCFSRFTSCCQRSQLIKPMTDTLHDKLCGYGVKLHIHHGIRILVISNLSWWQVHLGKLFLEIQVGATCPNSGGVCHQSFTMYFLTMQLLLSLS